jgi:hypothetical protein
MKTFYVHNRVNILSESNENSGPIMMLKKALLFLGENTLNGAVTNS